MKKKLSYRDKLVELAYIYDVKEIKDYEKSRKNLTSGQLELILKKNKITIPKDFKANFLRDNIIKPVGKIKSNLIEYKENKIKDKNRAIRKLENFKLDTNRKISRAVKDLWVQLGKIGLNFLNIIPKLGKVIYEFFGNLFTELFHGIYKQQIEPKSAKRVIIAIASITFVAIVLYAIQIITGMLSTKPFFISSFSEGNQVSLLQVSTSSEIMELDSSNLLSSKITDGGKISYVLNSPNFDTLQSVERLIRSNEAVDSIQLNK